MSLFSEIEKTMERGFRRWTERMFGAAESDDLLLLHHAILAEIEGKVQTIARGRRVFPYSRVTVTLVSDEEARRNLLQAAFGERLAEDVRAALDGIGCEVPRGFSLEVKTAATGPAPFEVEYGTGAAMPAPVETAVGRLVMVRGKTEHPQYMLEKARTNLGRLAELCDSEQRVVRRNDVVFEEASEEANATVSRRHAHIRREGSEYRIVDDESEFGTRVFRDGRPIEVPAGNRRGEKLRAGDEIYLGRACVRFEQ